MLFQMLKESSKKVGVYTSPHNIDIRERFETDQGIISKKAFLPYIDLCAAYTPVLSYYEKCVLIAFLYFRDQKVEYAIIEVGLGGRLDATNIIIPILSIITSISYDHMEFLGETLEQISYEKGGIIKSNIPVILYAENPTLESIALHRRSQVIRIDSTLSLQTNLIGDHQISNAQIAYEAGRYIGLSKEIMQEALLHVSHHGRLEYIETNLLIDGAHNEDGIRKLASYLDTISPLWNKIHYFFNLKSGKSARLVTDVFCTIEKFGVVDCNSFRISDAQTLREELRQI